MSRYRHLADGEWSPPSRSRWHKITCCACGLTHIFQFRISKGCIQFRAWQDLRATAQKRRHKRITIRKEA